MKTYKVEGIIIKRRDSGEADRIITIFSKEFGKLVVKAKGVRRITSKRAPHTELLNQTILTIYRNKNGDILTEAHSLENFQAIKTNLVKMGLAYHICELIDGLCAEGQEHGDIYELLHESLLKLARATSAQTLIRDFEVEILKILGFFPADSDDKGVNTRLLIEGLLERKLKSRQVLPKLL